MYNDTTAFLSADWHPLTCIVKHCQLGCDGPEVCKDKQCELWPFRNGYLEGTVRMRPEQAIYAYCKRCSEGDPSSSTFDCPRAPMDEEPCMLWAHRDPFAALLELVKRKMCSPS